MIKKLLATFVIVATAATPLMVQAAEKSYLLPYGPSNRWVAKEKAADLRQLIKDARAAKHHHFYVQLPEENRKLSVGRLIVLRDILEQQLKHAVILEEIDSISAPSTIVVEFTKKEN